MNFASAAREETKWTETENGAVALNTTGSKLLDFFATVGALRGADESRIERLFADAYAEDPLFATKIVFYGRDITQGLGERRTFRILLKYMANYHPEAINPNLDLIGEYGRYDDLYTFVGTPLEGDMWSAMKRQFEADRQAMGNNAPISLLAKWIKTADSSVDATRKLGIKTAHKLGYSVYEFKRIVRQMRKHLKVVECLMTTKQWSEIEYSHVPSRASMIYRNAFRRHDATRYDQFINKALTGEEKINSSTLYPYDLIERYNGRFFGLKDEEYKTVEALWRQLPNYVDEGTSAIVMADTSGSMHGRPMNTALGLAIYFAERNKGAYHNLWMSFSAIPKFHELKGETLLQKLQSIDMKDWEMNTNLKAAFDLVLEVAIRNHVPQEEMPKSIIVISDMEIDRCGDRQWTFYDQMAAQFAQNGYEIPSILFWNVDSRHDTFHADAKRKGVQLVSGQSTTTFKQVMASIGMTPVEAMHKTIDSDRYAAIRVGNY